MAQTHVGSEYKIADFLEELNYCAERAFGEDVQYMTDCFLYAKLPSQLKPSLNLALLNNGIYYQIFAHLERELEVSGLENDGELTIPTMTVLPQMIINRTLNKTTLMPLV